MTEQGVTGWDNEVTDSVSGVTGRDNEGTDWVSGGD